MPSPKVKEAEFRGKAKHLEYRARAQQPAMLCTLVMSENTDANGVKRYPVGAMPVMDPETGKTLVDSLGRISYTTSFAYGPTIGKNIALAYLPQDYCEVGRTLNVEYMSETYPVEGAGCWLPTALRPGKPGSQEARTGFTSDGFPPAC